MLSTTYMDLKGLGTKEVGPAYESFLTLNRHQGLVRLRQLHDFFSYLPAPVAGVCHFLPNNKKCSHNFITVGNNQHLGYPPNPPKLKCLRHFEE